MNYQLGAVFTKTFDIFTRNYHRISDLGLTFLRFVQNASILIQAQKLKMWKSYSTIISGKISKVLVIELQVNSKLHRNQLKLTVWNGGRRRNFLRCTLWT